MNKRVLIFLLAIVIGIFTYAGYKNVVVTDSQITNELHQTYDLAHELGIAYVWYDITIGDIMVRYSTGEINKEEMIAEIIVGKSACHKHLDTYVKSAKSYEAAHLSILHAQDSAIDEAIVNVITAADKSSLDAKVTAVYDSTRPILETINYTIATRSRYMECLNDNIQKDNEHIRGYLINTFMMSGVLFIAALMKLKEPEKLIRSKKVV